MEYQENKIIRFFEGLLKPRYKEAKLAKVYSRNVV